jgi:hypothetical protein
LAELTVVFGSFSEAASCSHEAADTDCACTGAEKTASTAANIAILMAILPSGNLKVSGYR